MDKRKVKSLLSDLKGTISALEVELELKPKPISVTYDDILTYYREDITYGNEKEDY